MNTYPIASRRRIRLAALLLLLPAAGLTLSSSAQDDIWSHLRHAQELAEKNNWPGAEAEYREAIRLAPDNTDAHFQFGQALFNRSDYEEAVAQLSEAVRLEPEGEKFGQDALNRATAEMHYHLGLDLESKGNLSGAIQEYRLAIAAAPKGVAGPELEPDLAAEHCSLAVALRKQGDAAQAQQEFRNTYIFELSNSDTDACQPLASAFVDDASVHLARGDWLLEHDEPQDAVVQYREVLRMTPTVADAAYAHWKIGEALRTTADANGVIDNLREAARLKPDSPAAWEALGKALAWDQKDAEAIPAYRKALELAPLAGQVHYDLGEVFLATSQWDAAVAEFRQVLRLNNANGPTWTNQTEEATDVHDLIPSAHEEIAVALERKGNLDGAIAEIRAELGLKTSDERAGSAHCLLAEILQTKGDPAGARREAEAADQLDPRGMEGGQGGCMGSLRSSPDTPSSNP